MATADGIFAQWGHSFGEAISSMAGVPASVSLTQSPPLEDFVWLGQQLSLAPDPLIWLGSSANPAAEIGKSALAGAGLDDPSSEDIEGTFRELVGQALSNVAQAVGRQIKTEVTCVGALEPGPPEREGMVFEVRIGDRTAGPFSIVFSSKLIGLLEATKPAASSRDRSGDSEGRSGIDLLLDVEMPVRVSFGKAQLLLRDVIKLTTGSIVELNRSISEPVEVLVNNCVIAKGEVVVVDGNYGVRIHQIISRQERLQSVK